MSKVRGVFNGTDAAVYLCVGFIPRKVRLWNIESASDFVIEWCAECMREDYAYEGWLYTNGVPTPLTVGAGVRQYEGGDQVTAAVQTDVTYGGNGPYLGFDLKDYRADNNYGPAAGVIDTWTLDTLANRSGHWNTAKVASGNRLGAGSEIRILETSSGLEKRAGIVSVGSDGEATDEVVLTRAIGSGKIRFITGMYDMIPIAVGKVAPAGILLSDVTLNNNDETIAFEMED